MQTVYLKYVQLHLMRAHTTYLLRYSYLHLALI